MPFSKAQPEDLSTFATWRTAGEKLSPAVFTGTKGRGSTSISIPSNLAVDIGQAVIKGAIEEALKTQLKLLGDHQLCPECKRACPWTRATTLQVRGGTIEYNDPS